MDPPTLSFQVIRNLGGTFCKIAYAKLTVEDLSKNKEASTPGGKKQTKKPHKDNTIDLDKTSKKKARK
jgi:hypothetical protein